MGRPALSNTSSRILLTDLVAEQPKKRQWGLIAAAAAAAVQVSIDACQSSAHSLHPIVIAQVLCDDKDYINDLSDKNRRLVKIGSKNILKVFCRKVDIHVGHIS
jgi:hypothetical protein